MSLYGDYIQERLGKKIIEDEFGFATYYTAYNNEYMYIEDLYVKPECRKQAKASSYADQIAEIAREKGIKKLLGSVNLLSNNPDASLKTLYGYGFKLKECVDQLIYLEKEIGV